jgi:hypothetical protein
MFIISKMWLENEDEQIAGNFQKFENYFRAGSLKIATFGN